MFVYHGDENAPSPPRCVVKDSNLDETIHETWDTAKCVNIVKYVQYDYVQYNDCY